MAMRVINVKQGTPEWHRHRANTFNASDAPAMMGCSAYKSRAELLREIATGEVKDVDAATQRRFDDGHKFEALARMLAEKRIGDDLSPITAINDSFPLPRALGASFDGITMMFDADFEHKSMNDTIRAAQSAEQLPLMYRVQMEQQLMVCPYLRRVMFMASKWNEVISPTPFFTVSEDGTKYFELIESREFWYVSDPALRAQIIEGWKRFAEDMEAAKQGGIKDDAPKGVAAATDTLPALSIQLKGEVTLSNLPAFQSAAKTFLAAINTDLKTDDDFATAKAQVRYLKETEVKIEASLDAALAQASSIDEMRRAVLDVKAKIAEVRLKLDRTVETREKEIKADIQREGMQKFRDRIEQLKPLFKEISPVIPAPDFTSATKNKRTIASLNNAVEAELNRALGVASEIAGKVSANLQRFAREAFCHETLFPDLQALIYKDGDVLFPLVRMRIAEHKAREEAKARAEEEERNKAKPVAVDTPVQIPSVIPTRSGMSTPAQAYAIPGISNQDDKKAPPRMEIVNLVADHWGVSISIARDWLRAEFGGE